MVTTLVGSEAFGTRGQGGRRIHLAREPDFRIGPLAVEPSRRRIAHADGREEIVEPRVMQVLAALADAGGAIVGRDELTERCWDGRIVGEDSINRVISRLRRLAENIGAGVFRIETVTKVGYRLALEEGIHAERATGGGGGRSGLAGRSEPEVLPGEIGRASRRTILSGFVAATAAAAAPAIWPAIERFNWFGLRGHVPNAQAQRFYDEGMRAQYHALDATSEIAEGFFRQAAEADPEWPDAWGSLAMSYRHMLDGETNVSQWRLVEQTRSAANRALELDPNNAEALVALALVRSPFRRWQETEAEYRSLLQRFPDAFVLRGHLGRLLRDVGRYSDSLPLTAEALRQQPFIVLPAVAHAQTLWGLGRLHEAAAMFDRIIRRWPRHMSVWLAYTNFLIFSGRAEAAVSFAAEREARPSGVPDFVLDRRVLVARAVATRSPQDIAAARAAQEQLVARSLAQPPFLLPAVATVPFLAAVGDLDTAFAHLEGFYFDRGPFTPPRPRRFGPLTRRESDFLFLPTAAPLRRDPRFAPLLERIGLAEYWRLSGTRPDIWRRPS